MFNNYILHAPETLVVVVSLVLIGVVTPRHIKPWVLMIAIIALFAFLAFYRGASFSVDIPNNVLICPCDGKVLRIYENDNKIYISIFLNIHNVHIQYVPIDGVVKQIIYKKGEFHPAYMFEKSLLNERMETTITTRYGDVKIIQIAGLVARRIKNFKKMGDKVKRGEPLGLIKLGSRVDVVAPKGRLQVREGQRVRIGDALINFR